MRVDLNGKAIRLVQDDITRVQMDAIANAANRALVGGGGVDGAIHRVGGPSLMAELNIIRAREGGCPTGSAVATTAGLLPARYVFHAVGPIYRDGNANEAELLASCYRSCLQLAEQRAVRRISFPSISTGVYGYPLDKAAPIALQAVYGHLMEQQHTVEEVTFVLFDERTYRAYERALQAKTLAEWR